MKKFFAALFFCHSVNALSPFSIPVAKVDITPYTSGWIYFASSDGIDLNHVKTAQKKTIIQPMMLNVEGHKITLNGKPCTYGMWQLLPKNNQITINTQTYRGPATLHITPQCVTVTAHVPPNDITQLTWGYGEKKSIKPASHTVRVLLHELTPTHHQSEPVTISSQNGFILYDPQKPEQKRESKKSTLELVYKRNKLWINQKHYDIDQLRVIPKDGYAGINGIDFHGSLSIVTHNNRTLIINHVDLEEYVYAVLKTESWPGWPIEVNKAFAIASRSYVMAMMRQSTGKLPYHVKNTNEHQTYKGMHASMTLRTAVEQTRGIFLMHNNEPALAMFDSCCGGIIPAHIDDFDFKKVPYLARTEQCTHCKRARLYSWKKEFKLHDFVHQIAHLLEIEHKKVTDVKVAKKDKAGMVHELNIKHGSDHKKIPGKQLYAAMKEIKSFCYNLQRKKDTLIFTGKGYGHHLGICQWGAREMVRDGWPYTRILDFYYPGTSLVKLS